MPQWYFVVAGFLLLTIAVGLLRVLRGPTHVDSMVAAQLFSTTGVAVLLLLGSASRDLSLYDVALTFVLLATLTSIGFINRSWPRSTTKEDSHDNT